MALTDDFMDEGEQEEQQAAVTLDAIMAADNVAELMPDAELSRIAEDAMVEYEIDRKSMAPWFDRMKRGIDLATLVKEEKTYPFERASNVKYPLITEAALMFNAKAYPAIVQPDQVVRPKVFGADPQGLKQARGDRVAEHMSYSLTCKVDEWEEDTDKLLTVLPIVGDCYRKVWHDPAQNRTRCRLVTPGSMIINDRAQTLGDAPRLTEEFSKLPSEIDEKRRSGEWRDIEYREASGQDSQEPEPFIEQHRRIDLDGDGYAEPYIVTVHRKLRVVARIVADFEMSDVIRAPGPKATIPGPMGLQTIELAPGPVTSIQRNSYYVHYTFLPSLDGGLHGTGLGLLLGDISDSINSIINLMIDAGHMASRGGGFIGSDWRIKGGSQQFKPGEWKLINAPGQAARDAIVPMTFPQADKTLFELLGLLIDAGKQIASIKDVLTGETSGVGNMTATTTLALIEQGMAQFTAAYKRIFRSLRHEFKIFAGIFARTTSAEEYSAFHDLIDPQTGMPVPLDPAREYDLSDMDIVPVADPNSVTKQQEAAKAQMLMDMAGNGLVNPQAASQRMLEAVGIPDAEELAPQPDPMQMEMMGLQIAEQRGKVGLQLVDVRKKMAEIHKLQADTINAMTQAEAVATDTEMKVQDAQATSLEEAMTELEAMRVYLEATLARSVGGMASPPGNGMGPGMPPGPMPAGPGGGDLGVLGGPPVAGAGAIGAAA